MIIKYTETNFEEHIESILNNSGYKSINFSKYDRNICFIKSDLISFIIDTQKDEYNKYEEHFLQDSEEKLLNTINQQIEQYGILQVLRKGIHTRGCHFNLVWFKPNSTNNPEHFELYKKNKFTLIRQLHFSPNNEKSIDLALFINGLPIILIELKNLITNQNIQDAEKQFREDRDPKEKLFLFKRCLAFFSVDTEHASITTRLLGKNTYFLPFNKEIINPINPKGPRTNYLWDEIMHPDMLLEIISEYACVHKEKKIYYDLNTDTLKEEEEEILIFPRYPQLRAINKILFDLSNNGTGKKYLIQHSTGSGKTLTISWLAHKLTSFYQSDKDINRLFGTIIVVSDRRNINKQLQDSLSQIEQNKGLVINVEEKHTSKDLKLFLEQGRDIIVTTIQKFPRIVKNISLLPSKKFAVIIDEAHASQSGKSSEALRISLSKAIDDELNETENINDIDEIIAIQNKYKINQNHVSYFGFSGTPKNTTLDIFGTKLNNSNLKKSFDLYSMKQSIHEGFTLDVLKNYWTYERAFKINQRLEGDEKLSKKQVIKKIVNFVDSHPKTIAQKTKIILEHFDKITSKKIDKKAKCMVVTSSRAHCILYKKEIDKQLIENNYQYKTLVAFSGEVIDETTNERHTEKSLNELENKNIALENIFKKPEYRILIVANKFQTGFNEPLLHSMYVDKKLYGLHAVQTLSRLNRTMSKKFDTFILDFKNKNEDIENSFKKYYGEVHLENETDPDILYKIYGDIEKFRLFNIGDIDNFLEVFFKNKKNKELIHPILDRIVDNHKSIENIESKNEFITKIKDFVRLYSHLIQIMTFEELKFEKLYVFFSVLYPKLEKQKNEKIGKIENFVDLDSLKIFSKFKGQIKLEDEPTTLNPIAEQPIKIIDDEKQYLSEIIKVINDTYGSEISEDDKIYRDSLMSLKSLFTINRELKETLEQPSNSESNKIHKFNEIYDDLIHPYSENKMQVYEKLKNPKIKKAIINQFYEDYKKGSFLSTSNNINT